MPTRNYFFFTVFFSFAMFFTKAQTMIPLYDGVIPNSKPSANLESSHYERDSILIISKVSRPRLEVFLPAKKNATRTAVIICPGGGYSILAAKHEGTDVAKRLNQSGIAAFVLYYRIPDDITMQNKEIGPLQDAQQAILVVRLNAKKWGLDPHKIGIMGFSAGGHLASTAGTHFSKNYIANPKNISLRPDFMILGYPVISFTDSIGHAGSAHNLLGEHPSAEKIIEYSNEKQVTPQTPPSFLVHAKDDDVVPVANSLEFSAALKKNGVAEQVYLYDKGGHGFGLVNKTSKVIWIDLCIDWMKKEGLVD